MIIKERQGTRRMIREPHYGKTLDYIHRLVAEARKDFPQLQERDIEVVVYGGSVIKRMMGIEFNAKNEGLIKDDYVVVQALPPTLS